MIIITINIAIFSVARAEPNSALESALIRVELTRLSGGTTQEFHQMERGVLPDGGIAAFAVTTETTYVANIVQQEKEEERWSEPEYAFVKHGLQGSVAIERVHSTFFLVKLTLQTSELLKMDTFCPLGTDVMCVQTPHIRDFLDELTWGWDPSVDRSNLPTQTGS